MSKYLSPDIYFEQITRDERFKPLERAKIDIAAFFGLSDRGPIQTPTRITSWEAYQRIFGGFSQVGYMGFSVFGFFNNGGQECFIIRVAHMDDPDPTKNASRASVVLKDLYARGTIEVQAVSEGSWGNKVKVAVGTPTRVHRTILLNDLYPGQNKARVDVSKGFEPGSIVRFTDGKQEAFVRLTRVDRKEIEWDPAQRVEVTLKEGVGTAESVEFRLTITGEDDFEIFDNLAMDPAHSRYYGKVVNGASKYVELKDLQSPTEIPYNLPQVMTESLLEAGRDGNEWVTTEDYVGFSIGPGKRRGLWSLEEVDDVGILCFPDVMRSMRESRGFRGERDAEAVQQAALDFCVRNRYCFALLDPPQGLTPTLVREWRDRYDSKYAALYYPWIKILDPFSGANGATVTIPPCGHIAGIYAKTDEEVGVHKPPANESINDVIALERPIDKDTQDAIYTEGVNCIRFFRGRGIRVWGSRTISSDAQWRHVNVRRIFNMLEKSIEHGTQWAPFEPNDPELWKMLNRLISTFLTDLWRQGYMTGATPEEAFFVKCDDETNPPEVRDVGEVICEIGVAAVRPLEFIVFRIGQRTKDIVLEEPV